MVSDASYNPAGAPYPHDAQSIAEKVRPEGRRLWRRAKSGEGQTLRIFRDRNSGVTLYDEKLSFGTMLRESQLS
ncbi:hypothetical protein JYU34_020803 [Plutella xylostella]|uniref:Uncharacterized protein n=1 Tax=Plutella xylostella TaxID=51655 RepID=A0ABQ7PRZ8_PLUXY|nr:hypothetical protein JYU34_020803 [Plutella xylostella]